MRETAEEKNSQIFIEPRVEIIDGYADNVKYYRELQICLSAHDWNKFVKQSFFQELIEYLGRIQAQRNIGSPGLDKEKSQICGKKKCPACGSMQASEQDNFCPNCGVKLKQVCECWVKKAATTAMRVAARVTNCGRKNYKPKYFFASSQPKSITN